MANLPLAGCIQPRVVTACDQISICIFRKARRGVSIRERAPFPEFLINNSCQARLPPPGNSSGRPKGSPFPHLSPSLFPLRSRPGQRFSLANPRFPVSPSSPMATSFDRWEKDPFFLAAEEVQESADRMESVYKIWVQQRSGAGGPEAAAALGGEEVSAVELRRELHTALGTAKWQLDELERAIRSNDEVVLAGKDTRARHSNFVAAIGYRILEVENNLQESNVLEGRGRLSWIQLDDNERDDLAAFLLASPLQQRDKVVTIPSAGDIQVGNNSTRVRKNVSADSSNDSSGSVELTLARAKEDAHRGHRRSVSANADIGLSTMSFPNEREGAAEQSSNGPHLLNIVKKCALTSALKPNPAIKYKKEAVRWACADKQDVEQAIPLRSSQFDQGLDGYSERSKSCLNTCIVPQCNKKVYGWLGAVRRKLHRSQYQVRYGRPVQLIVFVLAVLIIFVCVFKTKW